MPGPPTPFTPLPRIRRGQVIKAEFLNQIAEAAEGGGEGGVGRGGNPVLDAILATLAALSPDVLVWCRVKGVRFRGDLLPGGAGGVTRATVGLPSEFTYDYIGIGRPGIDEHGASPVFGRPVVNDEGLIHPCLPETPCIVLRLPTGLVDRPIEGLLWLIDGSEVPARRRCGTATSGGNGGGGTRIAIEEPPLRPDGTPGKSAGDAGGAVGAVGGVGPGGGVSSGPGGFGGEGGDGGAGGDG